MAVYTVPLPVNADNVPLVTLISPIAKPVITSVEVNVNATDTLFVVEPLVTPAVLDVMVMLGGCGGRINVVLGFPKNDTSTELGEVLPSRPLFIVIVRSA